MYNMQTLHTEIIPGEVKFNAPVAYDILHKPTNKIVNTIAFQKGPIKETGLNGIFLEDLLLICIDQLEHFQRSEFKCRENDQTLGHLYDALASTRSRQYDRMIRNVQGKNEI